MAQWKHNRNGSMDADQYQQLERIVDALERIADELERLNDRQGVAANSLLQLSDRHGSSTPGPY